jgi:hypothetical protein
MLFQDMLFHEYVGYNAIFEVFILWSGIVQRASFPEVEGTIMGKSL